MSPSDDAKTSCMGASVDVCVVYVNASNADASNLLVVDGCVGNRRIVLFHFRTGR